jgi:putative ABC transport system permease protein
MFIHLFKMIWNKKRQNFLLMTEILVSFLVIFVVCTLIVLNYNNFHRPPGFEHENVWAISFTNSTKAATDTTIAGTAEDSQSALFRESIRQSLRATPEVRAISFSTNNLPYSFVNNRYDIGYKNVKVSTNEYYVEDDYASVLNMKVLEGRWFTKSDDGSKNRPVVINQTLKEKLFGSEEAIGKVIDNEKIVGVIPDMKDKTDFQAHEGAIYKRLDTSELHALNDLVIRIDPNANSVIESRLYKTLANSMRNSNFEIRHLTDMKTKRDSVTLVPMIVLLVIAGFLIFNVALGLFGVLWYNINQRRSEIGLRRAIGASASSVSRQLIAEATVLASIALIVGTFFAIQFPLLGVFGVPTFTYVLSILLAIAFVYLLVIVCALYPGSQAAAIYPAIALYEE